MRTIQKIGIVMFLSLFLWVHSFADESVIVDASGRQKCMHGLHSQPNDGPFSVFLFCDDALGSNIGIILTERGAGPGNIELNEYKDWSQWGTVNRFWQDSIWSADVINFAWSPSQRYLYVATSGIYGDGGFFKLDFREHSYRRLVPGPNVPYNSKLTGGYFTRIRDINLKTGKITVDIFLYNPKEVYVATEVFHFE